MYVLILDLNFKHYPNKIMLKFLANHKAMNKALFKKILPNIRAQLNIFIQFLTFLDKFIFNFINFNLLLIII